MRVSVVIPAYNAAKTIRATLDSVSSQTEAPDEILVLDDGSTDQTASIVRSFGSAVTLFCQPNCGAAKTRNKLCQLAKGKVIAFLDADDLWHPQYLEHQLDVLEKHKEAIGCFTGHVNFYGDGEHKWDTTKPARIAAPERISELDFLKRYNAKPGFYNMSFFCARKSEIERLGTEPFQVHAAEDWFFFNSLALLGDVVADPIPLVAYRIREGSLSSDRIRLSRAIADACDILEARLQVFPDKRFRRVVGLACAAKRRLYAKVLLCNGNVPEARRQLKHSWRNPGNIVSQIKSGVFLLLTYLPVLLQPDWLSGSPQWKGVR